MKTLLLYILLVLFLVCNCEAADSIWELCNKDSNFTRNSRVSMNIDSLLVTLVSETPSKGFFTVSSSGQNQDKVYGLAQCRGDISRTDCSSCVQDAARKIRESCPNQSDSRILYDFCFLRYSKENFVGKLDAGAGLIYYNVANVTETDPETFDKVLATLFDRVRAEAVSAGSKGLGKDKTDLTPFVTLYGLVQCTRDLSELDCAQCFAIAVRNFMYACHGKKGCRVLYSSCYVRYEFYPFYFPLDSAKAAASAGSTHSVQLYP
ncbi:PREDICTED: cysteine-rich repeat secretory protein 55 [Tarenaya hassleriana]|uniref:cysteine-rich repeat secretory protein 55 n=1 Tax=Tarenaya hassleriana TaxID=28532 RepID=UPI00053C767E|nr:PREDICTED: cysteine-rich repeat secretory protein 55 [Tarenaya hassleriana]